MNNQLSRETLKTILQAENIEIISDQELDRLVREEKDIARFAPDGFCQVDPRNGDRIVYNSARARRPHDNHNSEKDMAATEQKQGCFICQGKTTGVVDTADLSEGFTFINKNLFPIFYPARESLRGNSVKVKHTEGEAVGGYHFLQWTSSYHERDWQNMPQGDRVIVLRRLAALEKKLLTGEDKYVSIIKNYGHLVGGSLAHGHQQIGVSNIMPNRIRQDELFREENGETFAAYMLRENPQSLIIKDYGPAVLLTPYFMRRPFDMQLVVKDSQKSHLFQLEEAELAAVADGWQDAIRIMLTVMPEIGKEIAYNVTTHNGPGTGLYFEFLPYTQEMGGFEHLGLYLCQGNPQTCANHAREILERISA